ncbi:MAG TPA: tetratricopeptide repeat protein [Gemmatimonadaceae bacterium]
MRYALFFACSIICLTTGALVTFDHISVLGIATVRADTVTPQPVADTLPTTEVATPAVPTDLDYARFAADDAAWRAQYARQYTLAELRARGDGKRSARDSVQDRVFEYVRANQRPRAIAELERWVSAHPGDADLLLSLARLLTEDGRSDDAVKRYRQILALRQRGE